MVEVIKTAKQSEKKTFPLPTEANQDGEISVRSGVTANSPLNPKVRRASGSVDGYQEQQDANEYLTQKEISQVYNNS